MPRVVPSTVVKVIDQLFPEVGENTTISLQRHHAGVVLALLTLVDQIPQELLPTDAEKYSALIIGLHNLRGALTQWPSHNYTPAGISQYGGRDPIHLMRDILAQCLDAAPAPTTAELLFIRDVALRESLRLDISTAYQALANGEWKPATVLAGAVVEAFLLWALQQRPKADYQHALATVVTKKMVSRPRYEPLDQWELVHYIAVAEELALIDANIATQVRLAKDFRNLIHPGRAQRLAQVCTRGTALTALAAMQRVIERLTP